MIELGCILEWADERAPSAAPETLSTGELVLSRTVEDQGGISIAVGDRVHGQFHVENAASVRDWLKGISALHDSHRA